MPRLLKIFFFCLLAYACDHLRSVEQDRVVARAGTHYLYESEMKEYLLQQSWGGILLELGGNSDSKAVVDHY